MTLLDPLGTLAVRGRADQLARQLDAPADGSPAASLAQALRATGEQLGAVTVPREQFRAELRTRLMAVAAVQGVGATAAAPAALARAAVSWRSASRAGGVAAGAMASVVAVTGVAVAGNQSLPGDPLYGVKRTTEALQLRFADGDVGRGTRHLDFAAERLSEVRGLALGRDAAAPAPTSGVRLASAGTALTPGTPLAAGAVLSAPVAERVRETLADMDDETLKGAELLDAAFRETRQSAPLRALSRFATAQSASLERLIPALPAASRERARTSLALVTDVAEDTEAMLDSPACGPSCDPSTAAPTAPPLTSPSANPVEPAPGAAPCGCVPTPAPQNSPAPDPQATPEPGSSATPAPEPTTTPGPQSTGTPAPSPTPSPTGGPLPLPLPSLPLPLPSLSPLPSLPAIPLLPEPIATLLPTLGPLQPLVDPLLPRLVAAPAPGASPAPRD